MNAPDPRFADRPDAARGAASVYLPRVVVGLFFLTLGALFLLDNMGYLEFEDYGRFWPVFVIGFGLAHMMRPQGRGFGFLVTVFGTWALLDQLAILEFDWSYVWPVFLLLIGAGLVWRGFFGGPGRDRRRGVADSGFGVEITAGLSDSPGGSRSSSGDPSSHVSAFAMLGSATRRSTAADFRGGEATAILGGCDLDLRQATPAPEGAVLDLFAVWGGIDVKVPPDWTVTMRGLPILGGFEDSRSGVQSDPAKQLTIKGTAIMGGIEVKT